LTHSDHLSVFARHHVEYCSHFVSVRTVAWSVENIWGQKARAGNLGRKMVRDEGGPLPPMGSGVAPPEKNLKVFGKSSAFGSFR